MHPLPDQSIREQIARYLAGEIGLAQFRDWVYPVLWEANPWDQAVFRLVSQVGILLAEFEEQHRTEEELRIQMLPFVTAYQGVPPRGVPVTGASNVTADAQWTTVGTGLVAVRA